MIIDQPLIEVHGRVGFEIVIENVPVPIEFYTLGGELFLLQQGISFNGGDFVVIGAFTNCDPRNNALLVVQGQNSIATMWIEDYPYEQNGSLHIDLTTVHSQIIRNHDGVLMRQGGDGNSKELIIYKPA